MLILNSCSFKRRDDHEKICCVWIHCCILACPHWQWNGEAAEQKRLAMVVKNIGNPWYDAIRKGWDAACEELGAESIFRGPEQPTPGGAD